METNTAFIRADSVVAVSYTHLDVYKRQVEGFYGAPWSQEARIRQLDFYGRNKMNVYIYGPKDDPYHRTPNWRKPYPARDGDELTVLVNRAKENNVIFYWAIHPGQDIRWNEEDRSLLLQKFESCLLYTSRCV